MISTLPKHAARPEPAPAAPAPARLRPARAARTLLPLLASLLLLAADTVAPAAARAAAEIGDPAEAPHIEVLPPETPWNEASRSLMVPADHPWATPFEVSGGLDSPSYEETVAWLERLAAASPRVHLVSLGESPEGRDVWMAVVSAEGAATPEALAASGKPVLLAQAGIHPGEIDGKDAGMMLLRDLTVVGGRSELLERASLLFVPILSVDGHERRSPYGRINQRGPATTGWRATSKNLNLNRDYAKLDTPEMRHMVAALGRWRPDLYLDLHVTDGADYQYDVTFGANGTEGWSPAIGRWLEEDYREAVYAALEAAGHVPGPLVFGVDRFDLGAGIVGFVAGPRFSNGYGDAVHLPTVLVENHSLKSFDRRVLGTYVLLAESLRLLGERGGELARARGEDLSRRPDTVPLAFQVPRDEPPPVIPFLGVEQRLELSEISGGPVVRWTGEPVEMEVPVFAATEPAATAERPAAYWIPPAWDEIVERLRIHGVEMEETREAREVEVEMYRFVDPELAETPFEGHVRVSAGVEVETRRQVYPPGSVRVPADQPLGTLAMLLLEPGSPDSFFQWGFFHSVLTRTEYFEAYLMEPLARRMMEEDPALAEEFRRALAADAELAADPRARLDWFYRRTPYFDERFNLYPVGREVEVEAEAEVEAEVER